MQTEWTYLDILKTNRFTVFPASTYALEYIVVVEVNVSDMILIQQLKSSLNLQIDNSTNISTVEITTGKIRIHRPFTNYTYNEGKNQSTDWVRKHKQEIL